MRQTAYAATSSNFPKLIERLSQLHALGIEPERATRVHQNYWLRLAVVPTYVDYRLTKLDAGVAEHLATLLQWIEANVDEMRGAARR